MPKRFEVHTIPKRGWRGLADYYETTIYDKQTDTMVACAGDTPHESLTNAEAYLAVVNHLKEARLNVGQEIVAAHGTEDPGGNQSI
jgi:uncharacterized protein (DUF427 family)